MKGTGASVRRVYDSRSDKELCSLAGDTIGAGVPVSLSYKHH